MQATWASALISHRFLFIYLSPKIACVPDNKHPNFLSQCNVYAGSQIQTAEKRMGNKKACNSFSNICATHYQAPPCPETDANWGEIENRYEKRTRKSNREAIIRMLCLPTWQEGCFWFAEVLSQLLVCVRHSSDAMPG